MPGPRCLRHDRRDAFLLETFNVPTVYVLCASRRKTSIVRDSGDGVSQIVPIYEGCACASCHPSFGFTGLDLTEPLMEILSERQYSFTSSILIRS